MLVADAYQTVCRRLLEPGGFQLGVMTVDRFLVYFADVLDDFLRQTGISKVIATQSIVQGVRDYVVPDREITVDDAFTSGRFIPRTTLDSLDATFFNWRAALGAVKVWHEDGLAIKGVEVVPAPNWNGTAYTPHFTPVAYEYIDGTDPGSYSGTASVSGTTVGWVSGNLFRAEDAYWTGKTILLGGAPSVIATVVNSNTLTLVASAASGSAVAYSVSYPITIPATDRNLTTYGSQIPKGQQVIVVTPGGVFGAGGGDITPIYTGYDFGPSNPVGQFVFQYSGALYTFMQQESGLDGGGNPYGDFKVHALRSTDSGTTWTDLGTTVALDEQNGGASFTIARDGSRVLMLSLLHHGAGGQFSNPYWQSAESIDGVGLEVFDLNTSTWGSRTVWYRNQYPYLWLARTFFDRNFSLVDSNGHTQLAVAQGRSGGVAPVFSLVGGSVTEGSGTLQWQDKGPAAAWQASHTYTNGTYILDPGNHLQITGGGVSGATIPTFNHSGGNTTDGTLTWLDKGLKQSWVANHNYDAIFVPALIVDPASHVQLAIISGFSASSIPTFDDSGGITYDGNPTLTWQDCGIGNYRWAPNYNPGEFVSLVDPASHLQRATAIVGNTGATPPTWNDSGGTTVDGGVTWQDLGHATQGPQLDYVRNRWPFFQLIVRGPSDYILLHSGPRTAFPQAYGRAHYTPFSGTAWGATVQLAGQSALGLVKPLSVFVDTTGVTHFTYQGPYNGTGLGAVDYHVSLATNGSFGTPQVVTPDDSTFSSASGTASPLTSYTASGQEYLAFVVNVYTDSTHNFTNLAMFSAPAALNPTWTAHLIATGLWDGGIQQIYPTNMIVIPNNVALVSVSGVIVVFWAESDNLSNRGPFHIYAAAAAVASPDTWTTPLIILNAPLNDFPDYPINPTSWPAPMQIIGAVVGNTAGLVVTWAGQESPYNYAFVAQFLSVTVSVTGSSVLTDQFTKQAYTLADTIPLAPDTAVDYLVWGILEKIFSDDAELGDRQKSAYAGARYREGINAFRSVALELLGDDEVE